MQRKIFLKNSIGALLLPFISLSALAQSRKNRPELSFDEKLNALKEPLANLNEQMKKYPKGTVLICHDHESNRCILNIDLDKFENQKLSRK